MDYPSVGIGILNWNGRHYLEQFLRNFYKVTYPNVKIYVIDNDSSDDSIAYLQQQHPAVKIIETGGNFGFAGGYNIGFAQMHEPYLLMINSDVEVTPGFLEPLISLMEQDRSIAVVQPKILSYNNRSVFEHAGAAGGMIDMLGYTFCRGRIFDNVEEDNNQYNTTGIFWASGACCLIKKDVYEQVDGMYDYYFMHFEEVDMCWRMQALNYRIVYCNESVVYHVGGGTLSYQSPRKTYYNFRNNLVMCYRNSPLSYLWWWVPLRFCLDGIAMLQFTVKGELKNAWAVWKGYGGFVKWLFTASRKAPIKKSLMKMPIVLKRSILWIYFVRGKKNIS